MDMGLLSMWTWDMFRVPSAFVKPFMEDRAPTLEAFMEDVRYTPDGVVPNE